MVIARVFGQSGNAAGIWPHLESPSPATPVAGHDLGPRIQPTLRVQGPKY